MKFYLVCEDSLRGAFDLANTGFDLVAKVSEAEVILVFGGDGAMLGNIRKFKELGLPFVGLHKGGPSSVGFLMNNSKPVFSEELRNGEIKFVSSRLLAAELFQGAERKETVYAFGDVYFRSIDSSIKVRVRVNDRVYFDPILCDAMIVCSSAGSTAYNFNAFGSVMHIDTEGMVLTAVAPQRFFGWHTSTLSKNDEVFMELVEIDKRPGIFVADGIKSGLAVDKVRVTYSDKMVRLGFAKSYDFHQKVNDFQFCGRSGR